MRADSSAITVIVFIECPSVVCVCALVLFSLSSLVRLFIRRTFIYQNVNNKRTDNTNTCVFFANERRKKWRENFEKVMSTARCCCNAHWATYDFFSFTFFFALPFFSRSIQALARLRFSSRSIFISSVWWKRFSNYARDAHIAPHRS